MIKWDRFAVRNEIRTLGIDLCGPIPIGVVLRGRDFVDGVLVYSSKLSLKSDRIAALTKKTRFFPELRLIMVHDPHARLNPSTLERITNLPVLETLEAGQKPSTRFTSFRTGRNDVGIRGQLSNQVVEEVLSATTTGATLPEPVRIAHTIVVSRILREKG